MFAKLGSDYKKPDATTVLLMGSYRKMIYPLPVSALLFVGRNTNAALGKMNITTIGELRRLIGTYCENGSGKWVNSFIGMRAGKMTTLSVPLLQKKN